ncbi:MarR family EPS-associated transcriptional regulator [Thioclava sp. F1Mire-8]|uniref:MarR family EPS-associated transcriptional regulator n=1 Tax=Thioclava sp. F1Mire-8 TaxID=1973006 RepID=UPI000B546492|nr:MarR family EPS-associated transcriptional regulator [Thioclava sp. F1Mire-8]OWY06104.1 MarR family EPS-associated transcriptional regulator [Thioclava sp. F1Mire-8]
MNKRTETRENIHFRLLCLLDENPEMSQRDLAREVGISTGSANSFLRELIESGAVKREKFGTSNDRRRYTYLVTSKGKAEKTSSAQNVLARKVKDFEALRDEIIVIASKLKNITN